MKTQIDIRKKLHNIFLHTRRISTGNKGLNVIHLVACLQFAHYLPQTPHNHQAAARAPSRRRWLPFISSRKSCKSLQCLYHQRLLASIHSSPKWTWYVKGFCLLFIERDVMARKARLEADSALHSNSRVVQFFRDCCCSEGKRNCIGTTILLSAIQSSWMKQQWCICQIKSFE